MIQEIKGEIENKKEALVEYNNIVNDENDE